ncbi:MAG TPA: glycoside hydrolase family 9 protein, partial [Humisphaera sp.]
MPRRRPPAFARLVPLAVITALLAALVPPAQAAEPPKFDYAEALQKSLWFYEAQRSGKLPADNRVPWRGDSALADGRAEGVDLTGGWYDAGDHVKFNLPMAGSATLLAWGVVDARAGYERSGQLPHALASLRWVCDYLVRCHTKPEEFWAQVGDGDRDHAWWGPPEVMPMARPAFKVDAAKPGSDVAGEAAAALAAASLAFRPTDPAYADLLLGHARQLHAFADARRGKYSDSVPQARAFYNSWSGFQDELVWSAAWLHRATSEPAYLAKAEAEYDRLANQNGTAFKPYKWTHSWDDKSYGCYVLLAKLTDKARYRADAERWLDFWTTGVNGERVAYTPGGLAWLDRWGSLRYAANTAFLALLYADALPVGDRRDRYRAFARRQIDYALGDNPGRRSFVCGFGNSPPRNPHHRGAHGSWTNDLRTPPDNRHVLYGALVGGPDKDDKYTDDRGDFVCNEVACDYNAAFTGALARLAQDHAPAAPPREFRPADPRGPELFVDASVNAAGDAFLEVRAVLHNHTAWPARAAEGVAFRYFADLSDVLAAGVRPDALKVTTNYNQGGTVAPFRAWDAKRNLYFLEVAFAGRDCYPGRQSESRREVQFRFALPDGVRGARWDRSRDPSFPAGGRGDDRNPRANERIAVYEGGKRVFGTEPGAAGGPVAVTPRPAAVAAPAQPTPRPPVPPVLQPAAPVPQP